MQQVVTYVIVTREFEIRHRCILLGLQFAAQLSMLSLE